MFGEEIERVVCVSAEMQNAFVEEFDTNRLYTAKYVYV